MKQFIKWLNKPLPEGVCWAMGGPAPCKMCWINVIVIASVITLAVIFTPDLKTQKMNCTPVEEISSGS